LVLLDTGVVKKRTVDLQNSEIKAITAPLAIFASNLLFCVTSFYLKELSVIYSVPILIIFGSNIVASYSFFIKPKQYMAQTKSFYTILLLWSFSYCFIYVVFTVYNRYLYVPHLVLIEAIAPFVVLFFNKEWRKNLLKKENFLESAIPLFFLLLLLFHLNGTTENSAIKYGLTFLLIIAFIISQYCYRVVSTGNPATFQVMHSLFSCLILVPFIFTQHINPSANIYYLASAVLLIGVAIILCQRSILFGIHYTSEIFSALLISTAIPLSYLTEFVLNKRSTVTHLQLGLSAVYCVIIFVVHYMRPRKTIGIP
jgi:hypothetical protein